MDKNRYWLGFSLIRDLGPKRIVHLRDAFGSLKDAWYASAKALKRAGFSTNLVDSILSQRETIDLDYEMQRVTRVKAFVTTLANEDYPPQLRETDDAPALLYVRGTLHPSDTKAVCVVGTRKATVYGKDATYRIAYDLASQGVTIISGLAHGIDTVAHTAALEAGGRTLAVSGCGISEIYPDDNLELARQITLQGAVVSEFPIGTPPTSKNFPRRNRIMSGMSLGVLVVEAGEKSGALITAGLAAEQGRDVFAVPSNIFNQAGRGTNRLIQDGAKLVTGAEDILTEIDMAHQFMETRTQTQAIAPDGNDEENALLQLLGPDPIHVDDLARMTELPVATVTSTLTLLELKGLAQNIGQMQYIRSR